MSTDNNSIYRQIQQETEQAAQGFGIDTKLSRDISAAITNRLRTLFGNSTVYFPGLADQPERYAAIKRDFDGKNHNEVCKKHGISRSTLYRALCQPK